MNPVPYDYGLWGLVFLNSIVPVGLAYCLFKPAGRRDWLGFGAYCTFIVALSVERYGFPLTTYLLSGWLGTKYPGLNLLAHDIGHLWWDVAAERGNPYVRARHILGFALIFAGFVLLSNAWHLYQARRRQTLSKAGSDPRARAPQYIGFAVILLGFLLRWPTLLTFAMSPLLVAVFVHLAIVEKCDSNAPGRQA